MIQIIYRLRLIVNILTGKYNSTFNLPPVESELVANNQLLCGKNAFITGAGQNIGRSIALEMAKQGANIYFLDIDQDKCKQLESKLSNYSVKYLGFTANITNKADIDAIITFLNKEDIVIDILVNNIGIEFKNFNMNEFSLGKWYEIYNTNVFFPLYLTDLISKMMIEKTTKGVIIFITSIHQWLIHRNPSYSSSKAAIGMIIKEMAIELAEFGIRVNGIAPSWVKEDDQGYPLYWKYGQLEKTSIPPKYIGRAAVYLASDYFSRYTTGTVLQIDNGVTSLGFRFK